jgi:hypothetical protein
MHAMAMSPAEALALVEAALGRDFLDAHLFTPAQTAQFETRADGSARLTPSIVRTTFPPFSAFLISSHCASTPSVSATPLSP